MWSCALHGRILSLRQDDNCLHYRAIYPEAPHAPPTPPSSAPPSTSEEEMGDDNTEDLVRHYLNLAPNLTELYEQWSQADKNFKKKAPRFAGIRILKQDAWEATVGFICSSNNNIIRISQMVREQIDSPQAELTCLDGKVMHAVWSVVRTCQCKALLRYATTRCPRPPRRRE